MLAQLPVPCSPQSCENLKVLRYDQVHVHNHPCPIYPNAERNVTRFHMQQLETVMFLLFLVYLLPFLPRSIIMWFQQQLEEKAAKPADEKAGSPESTSGDGKHQSTAQNIYAENRV